jgi:hypothetical protein
MGFLLFCFFSGWLMHKFSMKIMTLILIMMSIMVAGGYFFLRLI